MPSVRTNDVETYYERTGDGPPVIMAHGAGHDHRWWDPQVEALADDYELITYDLRGHGRTGGGADWHQYEMPLYALDLHRLVERLALDRPVVVGHSLGGMFLPEFAARYPESLRGLVLADAKVRPGTGVEEWLFGNVIHPMLILTNRVLGPGRAEALGERVGRFLADDDDPEPEFGEELEAYRESLDQYERRAEVTRVQRGLRRFDGGPLESVSVPTLGVYGDLGREAMAENAEELVGSVRNVDVREVDGAGHLLTWTESDAFNRALRSFLGRVFDGDGP